MARTPQKQTHHLLTQAITQLGQELHIASPEKIRRDLQNPHSHLLRAMAVVIAGELALKKFGATLAEEVFHLKEAKAAVAQAKDELAAEQWAEARQHAEIEFEQEQEAEAIAKAHEAAKAKEDTDPWGDLKPELKKITEERGALMKEASEMTQQQMLDLRQLFKAFDLILKDDTILAIVETFEKTLLGEPTHKAQQTVAPSLQDLSETRMHQMRDTLHDMIRPQVQSGAPAPHPDKLLEVVPKLRQQIHVHMQARETMFNRFTHLYDRQSTLMARAMLNPTPQQKAAQLRSFPFLQQTSAGNPQRFNVPSPPSMMTWMAEVAKEAAQVVESKQQQGPRPSRK